MVALAAWNASALMTALHLSVSEQKETAEDYPNILQTFMVSHAYVFHEKSLKVMQDGATNHLTCVCTEYFCSLKIDLCSALQNRRIQFP